MRSERHALSLVWLRLSALFLILNAVPGAYAHNLPYTLVEVERQNPEQVEIAIYAHVGAFVLDLPQAHLDEQGRAMFSRLSDRDLEGKIEVARRALDRSLYLSIDGAEVKARSVLFPSAAEIRKDALTSQERAALSEPIVVTLQTDSRDPLVFAGPPELGQTVIVAIVDGVQQSPLVIGPAQISPPISLSGTIGIGQTIKRFLVQGILHIVPLGLDHILFLLSLTLVTVRLKPLFLQVSGFTIAHTLTLGLTIVNVIPSVPGVVEPMISMSIVAMALLNLVRPVSDRLRSVLIVSLGLLHGLGFAGALRAIGLPPGDEVAALIAFNVGVEIGQVLVVSAALLVTFWFMKRHWFYQRVTVPASLLIALVGSVWTLQRTGVIS
jgi:hypothetical protein